MSWRVIKWIISWETHDTYFAPQIMFWESEQFFQWLISLKFSLPRLQSPFGFENPKVARGQAGHFFVHRHYLKIMRQRQSLSSPALFVCNIFAGFLFLRFANMIDRTIFSQFPGRIFLRNIFSAESFHKWKNHYDTNFFTSSPACCDIADIFGR